MHNLTPQTVFLPEKPTPWLRNYLYSPDLPLFDLKAEVPADRLAAVQALDDWLQTHCQPETLQNCSEDDLFASFMRPVLEQLGWSVVTQFNPLVAGDNKRMDAVLATDASAADAIRQALATSDPLAAARSHIACVCEAKKWSVDLDKKPAQRGDSAHEQIRRYMGTVLRVNDGFLSNARLWRYYSMQRITSGRSFVEIDLVALMAPSTPEAERLRGLALFIELFHRDAFVAHENAPTQHEQRRRQEETLREAAEANLRSVIYGITGGRSVFEDIGCALWQAAGKPTQTGDIATVYEAATTLLFRLLFIAYFEDRNRELLAAHPYWPARGLQALLARLQAQQDQLKAQQTQAQPPRFDGFRELKELFAIMDRGDADIDIPLFNGGLFDEARSPLLARPKVFDNALLCSILERLCFKTDAATGEVLGMQGQRTRRDYQSLSVIHLGRIYEGLLEYHLVAAHADLVEVSYSTPSSGSIEGYVSPAQWAKAKEEKGFRQYGSERHIWAGQLYLKNTNNSRKASASYYTPESLTAIIVREGLDHAHSRGRRLADIRILDNACGSGHFLVAALDQLSERAMQVLAKVPEDGQPLPNLGPNTALEPSGFRPESAPISAQDRADAAQLRQLLAEERQKIQQQLKDLGLDALCRVSDEQIIKRLLLKRCIYGVDLNPFAVELARLSLWMDSFIFGTPLSFIEHHIRHGDALLGVGTDELRQWIARRHNQTGATAQADFVHQDEVSALLGPLARAAAQLNRIGDATAQDVQRSKQCWADMQEQLSRVSAVFDLLAARNTLAAWEVQVQEDRGEKKKASAKDETQASHKDSAANRSRRASALQAAATQSDLFGAAATRTQLAVPEMAGDATAGRSASARQATAGPVTSDEIDAMAQHELAQLMSGDLLAGHRIVREVANQRKSWHFLHYEAAFPEVFASVGSDDGNDSARAAGFDLILGNPPWDKTKFADTDFFPQYIASYRSLNAPSKKAAVEHVLADVRISSEYAAVQRARQLAAAALRARFQLSDGVGGNSNLFRYFVERNLGLLAPGGALGYCLPSALMLEEGSERLRHEILRNYHLASFYSFENREALFPEVHRCYKFALIQVRKPEPEPAPDAATSAEESTTPPSAAVRHMAGADPTTRAAFYLSNANELNAAGRVLDYPLSTLTALSPAHWAMMELRDAADLRILSHCYARFDALSADWLDFRQELNMTLDSGLFQVQHQAGFIPLMEGKTIWQYTHVHDGPQYWLDPAAVQNRLRSKEIHRMTQDLQIKKADAEKYENAICFDMTFPRLAFRVIARDTDERTLVFALLPPNCSFGHSMFAAQTKKYIWQENENSRTVGIQPTSLLRQLFAMAIFNSLIIDWMARFTVQINVSKTYLERLPIPQPENDAAILNNPAYCQLARNALILTLAAIRQSVALRRGQTAQDTAQEHIEQCPEERAFAAALAPAMAALSVEWSDVPHTARAQTSLPLSDAATETIASVAPATLPSKARAKSAKAAAHALHSPAVQPSLSEKLRATQARTLDGLRAQNDRIVQHIYGLTDEDFAHICRKDAFGVLHNKRADYIALVRSAWWENPNIED